MSEALRNEYIGYRIKSAKETFESARILLQHKLWNSCINRLYYACFYMVSTLLYKEKITAKTHQGVRNQFNRNFIQTGIIKPEYGEMYSTLLDWRFKGDYGDLFDFEEAQVIPMIRFTEEFMNEIEKIIEPFSGRISTSA